MLALHAPTLQARALALCVQHGADPDQHHDVCCVCHTVFQRCSGAHDFWHGVGDPDGGFHLRDADELGRAHRCIDGSASSQLCGVGFGGHIFTTFGLVHRDSIGAVLRDWKAGWAGVVGFGVEIAIVLEAS